MASALKKISVPKHLSSAAKRMWRDIRAVHVVDDADKIALLQAACEAFDRANEARAIISRDGLIVRDRFGQEKAHPACAVERDARAAMIAALRALKLADDED
jgi:P27 family predicted phage terminase small subunit